VLRKRGIMVEVFPLTSEYDTRLPMKALLWLAWAIFLSFWPVPSSAASMVGLLCADTKTHRVFFRQKCQRGEMKLDSV
jgi:hypothetical protein